MSDEFFPEIDIREDQAEAIARGLYAVARADGNVHEREAAMITEFFNSTTDHASHLAALERAPQARAGEPRRDRCRATICAGCSSRPRSCSRYVDGTYAPPEAKLIGEFAKAFGIATKDVDRLEAPGQGLPDRPPLAPAERPRRRRGRERAQELAYLQASSVTPRSHARRSVVFALSLSIGIPMPRS